MADRSKRVRWSNYEALPEGEKLSEFFTHWWDPGDVFETETVGCSVLHIAPGEGGPMHMHDEPIEELYVVLEGTAEVETSDEVITANAGTIVYFPPGAPHRPTNSYDEPAIVLTFKSLDDDGSNRNRPL